jgi:cell division protein FtsN
MTPRDRSRDAAPGVPLRQLRNTRNSGAGGTLIGVFIGVVLGLAIAAGVAFYLMRAGNPYQASTATKESRDVGAARAGKTDAPSKPRFDFYKILPGGEEPKVQARAPDHPADKGTVERTLTPRDERATSAPEQRASEGKAADRFWLQAGSFANPNEAENLKARLALAGWEAAVQEAQVPDKGVRYRVRLGPYDNTDELNRIKGELARRGFDVAVIKF